MAKQEKKQQSTPIKRGMFTDNSYLNTPPGALTFALNTVNESEVGDDGWRSNEQSNEACYTLPEGYTPIGQIYVGKHETVIFSVSQDEQLSEIGITDANCVYKTLVRHYLGFKITNQISGTYRLRRGCERVLYFTTPTPMIYNIDKPEDFETNGITDMDKFSLFKTYESIPNFVSAEIIESGALIPGSYNAAIQYLDEDLNPTEWITTCEPIKIYNDSTSQNYENVRGSTSITDDFTNFGITNKSIRFTFSNFDEDYPLYRVAIIEANSGNGLVSAVNFSAPISTNNKTFTYSGVESIVTIGTEEEIIAFNNVIYEAEYVEQIENRLVLSETKGLQVNLCNLQKYASRIRADLHLSNVVLNQIGDSNPKTETVNFIGTGYMPGEIYSFGIVYIFEDNSLSPVYHIPGKGVGSPSLMSNDNSCYNDKYQDLSIKKEYWGRDAQGVDLYDKLIRHHRFPTRGEIGDTLYTQTVVGDPFEVNNLILNISNPITTGTTIEYRVLYKVNSVNFVFDRSFEAANYDPAEGTTVNVHISRDIIEITDVLEQIDGVGGFVSVPTDGSPAPSGLIYQADVVAREADSDVDIFSSNIMGIKFEGIEIPDKVDTNENQVIGYYIVRNERTEGQKTVLDTGVVTPTLVQDKGFIAMGHTFPTLADKSPISQQVYGLIHPEHLFNGREYKNTTTIVQHGEYYINKQQFTSKLTQDVGAGTSYNPDIHKKGGADYDGFSLHTYVRETAVFYRNNVDIFYDQFDQRGEIFYLNTLNFKSIEDINNLKQDVYNISGDNKMGVVKIDKLIPTPERVYEKLPYVVLNRPLENPYGTFRTLPYFKENRNPIYFTDAEESEDNGTTAIIMNGDSYITPMRHHSAIFYNFQLVDRDEKNGIWSIVVGALLVVAGIVGSILAPGAGTPLIAYGASIAAAGLGISAIASGVETNLVSKVYQEQYEAGLRDTITDDDTRAEFGVNGSPPAGMNDDEMQWLMDVSTNLWFESGVNMGLRNGVSIALTDFLNAPVNMVSTGILGEDTPLDTYALEKLTTIDTDNGDGRLYKGYAGAELYLLNRDYLRTNKQKIYFHLGIEYDCDSDCLEEFPHRSHYSEQSFQEELTDNYRTFLPNNYRDIEGEKGKITDVFRYKNNLYIQTTGALWHLPQNIQERVTGDVVSFIGTGSFFSIPPRLITDADKASSGTSHNWARMKTPNGAFFISADEGKPFIFDGNTLNPIFAGNENWFKNNLPVVADYDFLTTSKNKYPMANNPSNPYGTGFVSVYDTHKERFILTKRDFKFSQRVIGGEDYNACYSDGDFIIFDNYQTTIDCLESDTGCDLYPEMGGGWTYQGIEDCKMKFSKIETEITEEEVTTIIPIPSEATVWVALDMSGSFTNADRQVIKDAALAWEQNWRETLGWEGELKFYERPVDDLDSERWIKSLAYIIQEEYPGDQNLQELDIVLISFVNERLPELSGAGYHFVQMVDPTPEEFTEYISDREEFELYQAQLKSFRGICYPIIAENEWDNGIRNATQAFLQHEIVALYGRPLTLVEASSVSNNQGMTALERAFLRDSLTGPCIYNPDGLENWGWQGQWNRFSNGVDPVITDQQFANDINTLLVAGAEEKTETIITAVNTTVVEYIEGVAVEEPIEFDLSWTMSYSLKDKEWVSYHSYMPNFYFYRLQEFYSWKSYDSNFYKHNRSNHYQTFYGTLYPHIIEYVDNQGPRQTKIWDYVKIESNASEYIPEYMEDVDRDITFNKLIAYTSKQTTGLQTLVPKLDGENYLQEQVVNETNSMPIDRNERDWTLNDLRDIVTNYDVPLFRRDFISLQPEYFTDKVLNEDAIDYTKDWYDLQSFRDKYLVMRLIFDNFDNIRLVTNFTEEMELPSFR